MTLNEFTLILKKVKRAESITGKKYTDVSVKERVVQYTRKSSGNTETIPITELYSIYQGCEFINTKVVVPYITGRKRSPAVALLMATGLFGRDGIRTR